MNDCVHIVAVMERTINSNVSTRAVEQHISNKNGTRLVMAASLPVALLQMRRRHASSGPDSWPPATSVGKLLLWSVLRGGTCASEYGVLRTKFTMLLAMPGTAALRQ